jgi:hypothetical protein
MEHQDHRVQQVTMDQVLFGITLENTVVAQNMLLEI